MPKQYSIASLIQRIDGKLTSAVYQHFAEDGDDLVCVSGVLGAMANLGDKTFTYFDVVLRDASNEINIDIPKHLINKNQLRSNDYVTVVGKVTAKHSNYTGWKVKIFVQVSDIYAADSPDEIKRKQKDRADMEFLKRLAFKKADFPYQTQVALTIIASQQSQVLPDFESEIKKLNDVLPNTVRIKEILKPNMVEAHEISDAITKATGNVVVVLRGGGQANQFDCFDDTSVLQALTSFKGYRVLGLGHSQHRTLADLVCDHSANTPAQAGVHIAELVKNYQAALNTRLESLRHEHQNEALQLRDKLDQKAKAIEQLKVKNQTDQQTRDKAMSAALEQASQQANNQQAKKDKEHRKNSGIFALIAFVIGAAVMWWFKR